MVDEDPTLKAGRREAPATEKSGSVAPPVIAVRMEGLTAWVLERAAKFPRDHKFTIGDRLVETCLDITCELVEASYKRDRGAVLASASRGLVRARVLFRLARNLRLVSESQHLAGGSWRRLVGRGDLGPVPSA